MIGRGLGIILRAISNICLHQASRYFLKNLASIITQVISEEENNSLCQISNDLEIWEGERNWWHESTWTPQVHNTILP